MKLEDQVCNLELAKRLKELGVKQSSFLHWAWNDYEDSAIISCEYFLGMEEYKNKVSTFTVAELGEMLPVCVGKPEAEHYDLCCYLDHPHDWFVQYRHCGGKPDKDGKYQWEGIDIDCDKNLANGMAQMLIHLIEKGLVTP